jgi:hypothetical protein
MVVMRDHRPGQSVPVLLDRWRKIELLIAAVFLWFMLNSRGVKWLSQFTW